MFRKLRIAVATPIGFMPNPSLSCFFRTCGEELKKKFDKKSTFFWLEGGPYMVQNRTYLLEAVMKVNKKRKFDYLLWIDADQTFDIEKIQEIVKLAKKNKLDAISGLYYNRRGERHSMAGRVMNEHGDLYWYKPNEFAGETLKRIDVCGFGFFLISMKALEEYCAQFPKHMWFIEFWHGANKDWYSGEDIGFCRQFKSIGFEIYFAPKILVGHYGGIVPESFKQSEAKNRWQEVNMV